jgi:hypothetical protein
MELWSNPKDWALSIFNKLGCWSDGILEYLLI